jgi:Holliday junction resolvasome RuvABC DNA-binding subunit
LRAAYSGRPKHRCRRRSAVEPNVEDAINALVSIGYSEKQARAGVERAAQSVDTKNIEALVRAALAGA